MSPISLLLDSRTYFINSSNFGSELWLKEQRKVRSRIMERVRTMDSFRHDLSVVSRIDRYCTVFFSHTFESGVSDPAGSNPESQ
jgi:hypothetical protein